LVINKQIYNGVGKRDSYTQFAFKNKRD